MRSCSRVRRMALTALAALALAGTAFAESVRVSVPRANLRAEPSLTASVLGGADAGVVLEVLSSSGDWYRVKDARSGVTGYVHRSVVEPEPPAPAPEAPAVVEPEPLPPAPPAPRLVIQPPPPGASERLAFAAGLELGYRDLTRASSAATVAFDGARGGASFGAQARWSFARSLFLGASLRYFSMEDQARPLTLGLFTLHALAGAWLPLEGPVRPYLALGLGVATASEDGRVAGLSVSQSRTEPSAQLAAGVEYARQRLIVALEASWCTAPDSYRLAALAADGANLGGFAVVARVGLAF